MTESINGIPLEIKEHKGKRVVIEGIDYFIVKPLDFQKYEIRLHKINNLRIEIKERIDKILNDNKEQLKLFLYFLSTSSYKNYITFTKNSHRCLFIPVTILVFLSLMTLPSVTFPTFCIIVTSMLK